MMRKKKKSGSSEALGKENRLRGKEKKKCVKKPAQNKVFFGHFRLNFFFCLFGAVEKNENLIHNFLFFFKVIVDFYLFTTKEKIF